VQTSRVKKKKKQQNNELQKKKRTFRILTKQDMVPDQTFQSWEKNTGGPLAASAKKKLFRTKPKNAIQTMRTVSKEKGYESSFLGHSGKLTRKKFRGSYYMKTNKRDKPSEISKRRQKRTTSFWRIKWGEGKKRLGSKHHIKTVAWDNFARTDQS